MFLLLPIFIVLLFVGMWWVRRNSTLTRNCRWRPAMAAAAPEGQVHFRCVACGAETDCPKGKTPNDCLRLPGAA
ncbi:hypothetical protein [Acidimangrovimonas sediminis]|uniref:hypothetical protein n=1 Tax=Acidimangrovimonas sediminis TaxID=2056283 RepID=UPI000C80D466|nr:hypothetical protein [Acidimangrovimonas sediminis]